MGVHEFVCLLQRAKLVDVEVPCSLCLKILCRLDILLGDRNKTLLLDHTRQIDGNLLLLLHLGEHGRASVDLHLLVVGEVTHVAKEAGHSLVGLCLACYRGQHAIVKEEAIMQSLCGVCLRATLEGDTTLHAVEARDGEGEAVPVIRLVKLGQLGIELLWRLAAADTQVALKGDGLLAWDQNLLALTINDDHDETELLVQEVSNGVMASLAHLARDEGAQPRAHKPVTVLQHDVLDKLRGICSGKVLLNLDGILEAAVALWVGLIKAKDLEAPILGEDRVKGRAHQSHLVHSRQ